MKHDILCLAIALGIAVHPGHASAQRQVVRVSPELRGDVILGDRAAVHLGAGIQIPLGIYMRLGLTGAAGRRLEGSSSRLPGRSSASGRADILARFLLDPFRQTAYGLSLGGGLGVRIESGERVRPVLLVAVDLEGRRSSGGLVPAFQAGLGDGVRLGVVMRRGSPAGR